MIGANGRVVCPCETEGRCVSLDVDCLGYSSPRSYVQLEEDARAAAADVQAQAHTLTVARLDETTNGTALGDTTTFADGSLAPESSKTAVPKAKKKGKPKLTPKEKKERSVRVIFLLLSGVRSYPVVCYMKMAIDKVISSLPLEFRGSDPVRILVLGCHGHVLSSGTDSASQR
jgi:hypothetical protein